jgi:putative ubiquitin-RnfH superfamily antitoxin RatB of RatAB toxin-antitoxin module
LNVTVCFAYGSGVWLKSFDCSAETTAHQALQISGFFSVFPEVDVSVCGYGVFGQIVDAQTRLHNGDRLEVYRPLSYDPKVSRRRRATHRDKNRNIKKKVPINDQTSF